MKNKLFTFLLLPIIGIGILTVLSNCKKTPLNQNLCTPTFNLVKFEDNIKTAFGPNVMGYSYVITKNGSVVKTGAIGKAQNGADANINMSINLDMQVASVSKFITTVAAIHVCRLKGISLHTQIGKYLPKDWTVRGTGIEDVTIAELVTHTAGLNLLGTQGFTATRFDSLQAVVAAGATQPKTRLYSNTHHALLRIILPRIWDKYRANDGIYDADFFGSAYKKLVQELLFDKIGIEGDLKPLNTSQILAYNGAPDNTNGSGSSTDFTLVSGGTGWNLTCLELAKFWAYSFYSDLFIDYEDKEWAKNNRAGLWNSVMNGKYGIYYCKLGGWSFTSGTPSKDMNSLVMMFPNDYQVTIFTNSPVPGGSLSSLAANAFEGSFICQ